MRLAISKRALLGALLTAFGVAFVQLGAVSVKAGDPGGPASPPPTQARLLTVDPALAPTAARLPSGSADLVVIVSLDGVRPDAIGPDMQGLHRLYLQGASPYLARTISKSATLPSHASMVSGVDASDHGLSFNAYRPERGNIAAPTIFSLVHRAGLPTAMFVGKAKLKHLLAHTDDAAFKMGGMICDRLLSEALPYLQTAERGLVFLHFADPDSAGHRYGWMSDEYMAAVKRADRCLDRVLRTIDDGGRASRTLLITTSDHGGHNKSHGTRLDVDQHIPWFAWGAGVQRGRFQRALHTTDTAATTLAALGIPHSPAMQGRPVLEALGALGPAGMSLVGQPMSIGRDRPRR